MWIFMKEKWTYYTAYLMGSHGYLTHCGTMVCVWFFCDKIQHRRAFKILNQASLATLWFTERKYAETGISGVSTHLSPLFLSIWTDPFCYGRIRHPMSLFRWSENRKFRAENSFVEVGLLQLPHPEPDGWKEADLQGSVWSPAEL